eukprot:4239364-Alexandrium_andersonii.AAC.1
MLAFGSKQRCGIVCEIIAPLKLSATGMLMAIDGDGGHGGHASNDLDNDPSVFHHSEETDPSRAFGALWQSANESG